MEKETPLTFERFVGFYNQYIEPRFQKLETNLSEFRGEFDSFRDEVNTRFDDIYKKLETLQQEYLVISEQLKRIEENQSIDRQAIAMLKEQIINLQKRVEALEAMA